MFSRREFASGVMATSFVAVAGCTSEDRNEELAQNAADVIDENLGLAPMADDDPGWEFGDDGEEWFVEYFTSGDPRFDFQVAGGAYAGIVDDGFEYDAVLMAVGEDEDGFETTTYMAEVERSWAQDFMDDEISEEEYIDLIEDTMF